MPYDEQQHPRNDPHTRLWCEVIYLNVLGARRGDEHSLRWFQSEQWHIVGGCLFSKDERAAISKMAATPNGKRIIRTPEYKQRWLASREAKRAERRAAKEAKEATMYQVPTNETDIVLHA